MTCGLGRLVASGPALADTITVTNTNDAGAGSLRQAIIDVMPAGTIVVPSGSCGVASGELAISKSLTISGAGAATTIIRNVGSSRVFHTSGGDACPRPRRRPARLSGDERAVYGQPCPFGLRIDKRRGLRQDPKGRRSKLDPGKRRRSRAEDCGCRRVRRGGDWEPTDPLVTRSSTASGITLHLSDEVATHLAEEAARQSLTPEELAAHMLAEYVVMSRHHDPGTTDKPTSPVTAPTRRGSMPDERQAPQRPSALRLIAEVPSALWVGLFLLFFAAMFILIVALIAQAL